MNNLDVRMAIKEAGIHYWQVAKMLGIADTTFSKRFREEMTKEEKEQIYEAIKKIKKED